MLAIGTQAPDLRFETVSHGAFDLTVGAPAGGTLVSFIRGRHCKWTRLFLKELDDRIGDFALRGIRVIAASGESLEDTEALKTQMQLIRIPLGHSLDVQNVASSWGLALTRNSTEPDAPALHLEPAQIWIRQDNTVGSVAVQSGPNLWADATNTIRAIENTMNKYPERGAATGTTATEETADHD